MKERPILMSAPMVRAILAGNKNQTRRVMKHPVYTKPGTSYFFSGETSLSLGYTASEGWFWAGFRYERNWQDQDPPGSAGYVKCPHGQPGDRLIPAILVEGYDQRYCADVFGCIWSKASGEWRQLKTNITANYSRLTLRKEGRDVNRTVHRIVCEAFYGPPPFPRAVVRHLNGNSLDNAPENLDWGTYTENWKDCVAHGRNVREAHHAAKLTMNIAREMRASGKTAWALSKQFKVSPKTVARVLRGETWRDVARCVIIHTS